MRVIRVCMCVHHGESGESGKEITENVISLFRKMNAFVVHNLCHTPIIMVRLTMQLFWTCQL